MICKDIMYTLRTQLPWELYADGSYMRRELYAALQGCNDQLGENKHNVWRNFDVKKFKKNVEFSRLLS